MPYEGETYLARANVTLNNTLVPIHTTAVLAPTTEVADAERFGLIVRQLPDGSFPDPPPDPPRAGCGGCRG